MNRDDENWFDALAGKPNPDTAPSTLQEATALRAAILASGVHTPSEQNKIVNFNSIKTLKERLRSEGLLDQPQNKSTSRRTIAVSLAASIFVCFGIGLSLQGHYGTNESDLVVASRGGEELPSITVPEASVATHQLEQHLSELKIQSRVQCAANSCIIEAYIPSEQEEAVNVLIKPNHASVGTNGQLLLRFHSQENK